MPIKPGDTIVVPLDTEHIPALPLWTQVTQILYNVAIAVTVDPGDADSLQHGHCGVGDKLALAGCETAYVPAPGALRPTGPAD